MQACKSIETHLHPNELTNHTHPNHITLLVVATEPPLEPTNRQPMAIAVPKEVPPVPTTGNWQSLAAAKAWLL